MNIPIPNPIARSPLLTDLYELTMCYGYWKSGKAGQEAAFHLFFRTPPFGGGFTLACGLDLVIDFLQHIQFNPEDLDYLATLTGHDGRPLFDSGFLDHLRQFKFTCSIDAVPEGTVVFAQEPLVRVQGPLLQSQLIETALLHFINFQTLIATKAARVCLAAQGEPVIEFGLRRAQGADGGVAASRAAFIGGCVATSNVLAGKTYGIPLKGTHAHSWVLSFDSELAAFEAYARAMPNNCVFLVDTCDSLEGVRHAIEVGRQLREQGHEMIGIRLDSGDLAYLSIEARRMLDGAGFPKAAILASNNLDEHLISSLKLQGARVNVWGVGTRLVTAYDHPALGGVYKLSAIRGANGRWEPRIKISEQTAKITTPGLLQIRRFSSGTEFIGDAIYDITRPLTPPVTIVDPLDLTRRKRFGLETRSADLLVPVFRNGTLVCERPGLEQIREQARQQLDCLHPGVKRFINPHQYPVGLEQGLHELKTNLVLRARRQEV